jgi:hypothetical protein
MSHTSPAVFDLFVEERGWPRRQEIIIDSARAAAKPRDGGGPLPLEAAVALVDEVVKDRVPGGTDSSDKGGTGAQAELPGTT